MPTLAQSHWQPLKSELRDGSRARLDPYLLLADATDYADYRASGPANGDELAVAVEVTSAEQRRAVQDVAGFRINNGYPQNALQFTGLVTRPALKLLLSALQAGSSAGPGRVLLAEPLLPQRPPAPWSGARVKLTAPDNGREDGGKGSKAVLLAMIDTGCPFAHRDLRGRIVRLWDQGSGADWAGLGRQGQGVPYGRVLQRNDLNVLMQSATSSLSGSIDEAACYRSAGYAPALMRASHGAHSLGMLAAPRRWNAVQRMGSPEVALKGPSASADIIFVQLAQELTRCVSVAALESRAIDAFRYILDQGRELGYERIVASFGYESWLGPHDGSSWFEKALDALIEDAGQGKPALEVHAIAGNAKSRDAHVALGKDRSSTFELIVQPGNETATWVEIWVPGGRKMSLWLTPPQGPEIGPLTWGDTVAWPDAERPQAAVVMQKSSANGSSAQVLLRVGPTQVCDRRQSAAPHGRWSIRLCADESTDDLRDVHAYVGRSEESMGAAPRARQSCFGGRKADQKVHDKAGTMNGHCGGKAAKVWGAYYRQAFPYLAMPPQGVSDPGQKNLPGEATPYSGAGPMRGDNSGKAEAKQGPDYSIAVEDGLYRFGVLGMGSCSGTVFRLQGTSVAAPSGARLAADDQLNAVKPNVVRSSDLGAPFDPFDPGPGPGG